MKVYQNDSQQTRIALLESAISHINESLVRIENKIDKLDENINERFKAVDEKFNTINEKFDQQFYKMSQQLNIINNRLWSNFYWLLGGLLGGFSLIAKLLKLF